MSYIGTSPSNGVRRRVQFTATAGQTSFSGADENANTLTYVDGLYLDVYQNGVKLKSGDDYTATTGTSVVLAQGASINDVLEFISFDVFSVNDSVSAKDGGGFGGDVSSSGTFLPTGDTAAGDNAAIGFTSTEGLILTGQGSTSDITVKNDADETIIDFRTGDRKIVGNAATQLMLGGVATSDAGGGFDSALQIEGTTFQTSSLSIFENAASAAAGALVFGKSRGTAVNSDTIVQDGDSLGAIYFYAADGVDRANAAAHIFAVVDGTPGENDVPGRLVFSTTLDGAASPTERMRIRATGQTIINGTSVSGAAMFSVFFADGSKEGISCQGTDDASGSGFVVFRKNNGNVIGQIKKNGTTDAVQYVTTSDYRLKENVSYSFDATTRVKQLKPARFNFISDPNNNVVDGFLAHEVSSIVPEAIDGDKDATQDISDVVLQADGEVYRTSVTETEWTIGKSDGTYATNTTWVASKTIPNYQGIDQSKLVPLLTKALQEQQDTIEALTARITALENA